MLKSHYYDHLTEAGCDEAGRGCLAGSVYAAAVILPPDYTNDDLNDSKKLTEKKRYLLRTQIQHDALAWAVGVVTPEEIDKINILNASILAMHRALDQLSVRPEAASILAKTYRDDYMNELAQQYPQYGWQENKGYPTRQHREAIRQWGVTPLHRKSYNLLGDLRQLTFDFGD